MEDGDAILVTAQKRVENVQQVPISVAAFDAGALLRANVVSAPDLTRVAPGLQISRGTQSAFLRVAIRGIGTASNTTIEPSVAVFVDGVYMPRPGAIVGTMLDMDSVEILRGPQGTLFGRNASAGAIQLNTPQPKPDFSAGVTEELGNGSRYKLNGYVNLPLGSAMALRVAGSAQWFGGFWRNRLDGKRYGGADDLSLRASYKVQAGGLTWLVRADHLRTKGDGSSDIDFDAGSVSPAQLSAFRSRLGGGLPDLNMNDTRMNQSITADLDDRQWGLWSTLSFDHDGATIRLIDSYRDWRNRQLDGDVIYTPVPILSRVGNYRSKSHNHELQFISPERKWLGGRLDMVGGLYLFSEDYALGEKFQMRSSYCDIVAPPGGARADCNAFLAARGGRDATNQQVTQATRSYAAYGQATMHLTKALSLTLGGRYSWDRKQGAYSQTITNPYVALLRAPEVLTLPDVRDERFTYRLGLGYRPKPDVLVFASLSTGYKSAGYNSGGGATPLSTFDASGNLVSTRRLFARETSRNVELGAKTSWLSGRLTANLTLYRMEIDGYQDRAFDGISFVVLNAGSLRQQGFEYDMIASPAKGLRLTSSVAYLDSRFLEYPNAPGLPGLGGTQDLKGKPTTASPKWTGRIAAGWTQGRMDANLGLSFVSSQFLGLGSDANPQTVQKGYALLDARLTLNAVDRRWALSLFGTNLTDATYAIGRFYQVLDGAFGLRNGIFPGSTAIRVSRAYPRSYGLSASFWY
ncbi:MAG TPA: TonB-dependent receptor [Novosphingobium sp.]